MGYIRFSKDDKLSSIISGSVRFRRRRHASLLKTRNSFPAFEGILFVDSLFVFFFRCLFGYSCVCAFVFLFVCLFGFGLFL